jgi:hypothetical protein
MNNYMPQEPSNSLGRMYASREKQIAFNKIVLKKEEVIAIHSEVSDFLNGMRMDEATIVCVNVSQRMGETQPISGQLWVQGEIRMTATSSSLQRIGDT